MDLVSIKQKLQKLNSDSASQEDKSYIWQRVEKGLQYVWDLSPKNLQLIRLHTELFSGENLSSLFFQFVGDDNGFAKQIGYVDQISDVPEKYHVSEPELEGIGPIGFNYQNKLLNIELIRYQEYISNFYRLGMFDNEDHKIILEIGGGYGAIPYHLLKMMDGKATMIMIDLPVMLLFAAAYIKTNLPNCRIHVCDNAMEYTDASIKDYDVVLIPHYKLETLNKLKTIDYAINTISFAEMTDTQLRKYLLFIQPRLKQFLLTQNYSWGREPLLRDVINEYFTFMLPKDYWEDRGFKGNFLRSFFCVSNPTAQAQLQKKTIRIKNPDGKIEKIKLRSKEKMMEVVS